MKAPTSLYVVPTPIGNLQDMTPRAMQVLSTAQVVLAEDTRTTGQLLKLLGLQVAKLERYHAFNEHKAVEHLVTRMQQGTVMALVSDAGTPAISDPGFLLVREAIQAGLTVECLPGATAFVPALVLSGLPCHRFVFEGFLPLKKGRATRIKELAEEDRTVVLYESPHRILKTLQQLAEACQPTRQVCVVRELTKMFEEAVRGTLAEVATHFTTHGPKGEFVIVLAGKNHEADPSDD